MKIVQLFFLFLFISGVGFATEGRKDKKESLTHDGLKRTYLVHLPQNYDPQGSYPLVFALHGGNGTAKRFNRSTRGRFNELSDEENFILVYPQGIKKSWNDNPKRNQKGARKLNIDDVGFFKKLIEKLEADYAIDSNNIFACGISNGGLMSQTLVSEIPTKIKAIGMVASNFGSIQASKMTYAVPFSMILIHGTTDPIFPYEGGEIQVFKKKRGEVLGVDNTIELMCTINGNIREGSTSDMPNLELEDSCTSKHTRYPNPKNPQLKLELINIEGGGHTWPGGYQYLPKKLVGNVSLDFNASDALWAFFKSTIE